MSWQDDVDREVRLLFDNHNGLGKLYALEREFWFALWGVPIFEAIEDDGIEARRYGPAWAFTIAAEPRTPLFNLVLGAERPGAVEDGHLADLLDWTESRGVDCRIPIRLDLDESAAAEDLLNRRGYRRTATLAMFVRDGAPPSSPMPPGIGVEEMADDTYCEGFSTYLAEGYGMADWTGHGFFISLLERREWRNYFAVEKNGNFIAAATMMVHYEVAQLGFAGTWEEALGRGAHSALIHRRIEDGLAAGAKEFFAVTEESPDCPDSELSTGARNLVRAGFRLAGVRPVWRPPERLIAGEDDDDADGRGEDDEGVDDDHDFELGH